MGYAAPGAAGSGGDDAALQMAAVDASTITYVECHATGTLIGDGIELRALGESYCCRRRPAEGSRRGAPTLTLVLTLTLTLTLTPTLT